jgi:Flp pilus assembly protein TadG
MKHAREDGAAALEFAIILPIFMLIIFGIVEFGFLLNRYISVAQAAREGARVASLGYTTDESEARAVATTPDLAGDIFCSGSEGAGVSGETEVVMHCESTYDLTLLAISGPVKVESTTRMRKEGG